MVGTKVHNFNDRKCTKCSFYYEEWEGEYGGWYCGSWCQFGKREHYGNLKTFPFKNGCKDFVIEFWFSEFAEMIDGTDESYDKAIKAWNEATN